MTRRRGCEWTGGNPDKERVWAEAFGHLATFNLDKKYQTPHDANVPGTAPGPTPSAASWTRPCASLVPLPRPRP